MPPGDIRHIAASTHGNIIAAGEFERTVHIWDAARREHLREFETILDYGGYRLDIDAHGRYCAAGTFSDNSVALYAVSSGEQIWRRRDIAQVQKLTFSPSGRVVACATQLRELFLLDAVTGETRAIWDDVRSMAYGEEDESFVLFGERAITVRSSRGPAFEVGRESFGLLSACFAGRQLCISEAAGPLRCFDLERGTMLWRFSAYPSEHVLQVAYDQKRDSFLGLLFNVDDASCKLMRFSGADGAAHPICPVPEGSVASAFLFGASLLLTWDGLLRDTLTGEVVDRIALRRP